MFGGRQRIKPGLQRIFGRGCRIEICDGPCRGYTRDKGSAVVVPWPFEEIEGFHLRADLRVPRWRAFAEQRRGPRPRLSDKERVQLPCSMDDPSKSGFLIGRQCAQVDFDNSRFEYRKFCGLRMY